MGDEDYGYALFTVHAVYGGEDLLSSLGIQHGCGLVEDYALGFHGDYARDSHSLLLSARELAGRMEPVIVHSHSLQALVHAPAHLLIGNAQIFQSECHILLDYGGNNLVVGVLEYHSRPLTQLEELFLVLCVYSVHRYRSLGGEQYGIQMLCKSGFSAAVVPQHCHELPLLYVKVYALEHLDGLLFLVVGLIGEMETFYLDYIIHIFPYPMIFMVEHIIRASSCDLALTMSVYSVLLSAKAPTQYFELSPLVVFPSIFSAK